MSDQAEAVPDLHFTTRDAAIAAALELVAEDGTVWVHEERCDGEDDCGCAILAIRAGGPVQ